MNLKVILALHLFAIAPALTDSAQGLTWFTDLPAAQAKAKAENKAVLLNFTGSDWCGWCIRLKQEVFSQPEFETFASENLVVVEIDFPHHKRQSTAVQQANQTLAEQHGVEGFPTVIILNAQGLKLGTLGYEEGGAKNYVALLKKHLPSKGGLAGVFNSAKATLASAAPRPEPGPTAPRPNATAAGASELTLKGISGTKEKRLAMINDQTFAEGEAGIVRCGIRREKIRCMEIRENSVVILLAASQERKELKLRPR